MDSESKILVTGYTGVLGTALLKLLTDNGYKNIIPVSSQECNLLNKDDTTAFFQAASPDYVFHLAGYVKGIMGNMENKGSAYLNNIYINTNTIEACRLAQVKKVVAVSTVAAYPDPPPALPLKEEMIWDGYPHKSEEGYAHAKRAMLGQLIAYKESYGLDYAYVIATNLYGPNDRFDTKHGHVIPSLVAKFHHAQQSNSNLLVWGDGSAERDFIYSVDAARALIMIMRSFCGEINLATSKIYTIKDIVNLLAGHIEFPSNKIQWDATKPNGQLVRSYNIEKLEALGFRPEYNITQGLQATYDWYAKNAGTARK